MPARPERPIDTKFEGYGTLKKPGPVGRIVRLAFGVWLLSWTYTILTDDPRGMVDTTAPRHWMLWAGAAVAFWVTPYVINIGFTRSWRRRPQYVLAALLVHLPERHPGRATEPARHVPDGLLVLCYRIPGGDGGNPLRSPPLKLVPKQRGKKRQIARGDQSAEAGAGVAHVRPPRDLARSVPSSQPPLRSSIINCIRLSSFMTRM